MGSRQVYGSKTRMSDWTDTNLQYRRGLGVTVDVHELAMDATPPMPSSPRPRKSATATPRLGDSNRSTKRGHIGTSARNLNRGIARGAGKLGEALHDEIDNPESGLLLPVKYEERENGL
jgi:hypothetical protein